MKIGIKKGFTFAELMISLVVIAVITAILYPTISELAPNNNRHLFKSAYKTIELVVSDITTANEDGNLPNSQQAICEAFEERLNTVQNTESDNCSDGSNFTFTTTNGMRWHFVTGGTVAIDGVNTNVINILIDVNASNNEIASSNDNATLPANVAIPAAWGNEGVFLDNDNIVTNDTFVITVTERGKIIAITNPGRAHLLEQD